MHFSDRLFQVVQKKKSPLCVGLDPHWDLIPDHLKVGKTETETIEQFFTEILEETAEYAACVKPNTAFFEVWGSKGWEVLERISEKAQSLGLLVIADAKRNDIGTTAAAYAEAFLGAGKPYDALTVTPYLGQDGILPFLEVAVQNEKGIFVLVKTSNQSSGEFQDLPVGDALLHEEVARAMARIGMESVGSSELSDLGAVVGATYPEDITHLRREMPQQIFLIPGYGSQGGSAEDVRSAFYEGGKGAIINSSRGILFAGQGKDFAKKAGEAAKKSQEELWAVANS